MRQDECEQGKQNFTSEIIESQNDFFKAKWKGSDAVILPLKADIPSVHRQI